MDKSLYNWTEAYLKHSNFKEMQYYAIAHFICVDLVRGLIADPDELAKVTQEAVARSKILCDLIMGDNDTETGFLAESASIDHYDSYYLSDDMENRVMLFKDVGKFVRQKMSEYIDELKKKQEKNPD